MLDQMADSSAAVSTSYDRDILNFLTHDIDRGLSPIRGPEGVVLIVSVIVQILRNRPGDCPLLCSKLS